MQAVGLQPRTDHLLKRLSQAGIAVFLLISAFDIHRWRVERWREFDAGFLTLADRMLDQSAEPAWLYAIAFPVVAVNFGCMVQLWRGRLNKVLFPFVISAAAIAFMPLLAWQTVGYVMVWERILTMLGYFIGGAIALLLYLDRSNSIDATNNRVLSESK